MKELREGFRHGPKKEFYYDRNGKRYRTANRIGVQHIAHLRIAMQQTANCIAVQHAANRRIAVRHIANRRIAVQHPATRPYAAPDECILLIRQMGWLPLAE